MDREELKEEVRARADIVDIIGRVVRLQKAGTSYKGLCPFHNEKTPSFHVDPKKQTYHCFGCGAGGDVFSFVMAYEHLDFLGALERLAGQVGVEFELSGTARKGPKKDRLFALHERAAEFFQQQLKAPAGAAALAYTRKRALSPATLADFRIGYAPDSFDQLLKKAREWGFSEEEIEASGLFVVREEVKEGERFYDRFRNRLMFPISDEQGRVIGFSGRVLNAADSRAKYVNSPETLLFKKSRVLYGIHRARMPISSQRKAVLCEGQLDVIRSHEAGVTHAVAAQGTAVNEEHARILKRYADEVTLMLDADAAGIKAALRSAEVLLASGLSVRVASLPAGEDPDSLVTGKGGAALLEVLAQAEPFIPFQVRTLLQQAGELTETSRLRVAREVMKTIALAREAIHREELIRQAARSLGLSEQALREDLSASTPTVPRPADSSQPPPPSPSPASRPLQPSSLADAPPPAEKMLLELLLAHPELIPHCQPTLRPEHFRHGPTGNAFSALLLVKRLDGDGIKDALREHSAAALVFAVMARSNLKIGAESGDPLEALRELILHIRRSDILARLAMVEDATRKLPASQREEHEATIWQLTLHARRLEEYRKTRDWVKAAALLDLLDSQRPAKSH